tara:strand:+ start:497 stop:1261 length:765 start_codon:yes stop_codon:yes gene_type:complete
MVSDKTPLFVETDEAGNVTSFAEFVSGTDVIPQELGGTGATSVSGLGSSILVGELATAVSGAAQLATGFIFNPGTGSITPEPGMTTIDITGKSLILNALTIKDSSFTVNGTQCPVPLPFGYAQCDSAGTDSTDEQNFGLGATITNIVSNTDDITWDDTNKYFVVAKAGTYELLANLVVDAGAQNEILTVIAKVNGVAKLTIAPRVYGSVGPVERTFQCVLTATAGQNVSLTLQMGGTKTIHLDEGSTYRIGRLK